MDILMSILVLDEMGGFQWKGMVGVIGRLGHVSFIMMPVQLACLVRFRG